jgi:predicted DNA-binding transcriptional regulator AlpA
VTLLERLAQLPDTALVPVAWVRELLAAENGAPGGATGDDPAQALPGTLAGPSTNGDRLLTADEAAARLGVSVRWCYDHAAELGVRKLSRRCVRFSAAAVERRAKR